MKYVKIVSKSVTTPEDMFTLGVSTSRGKADKIGQFGSGTLLGTLAWLREFSKSPVFMVNGKKVTFETRPVTKSDGETFQQVLLCHSRRKSPLSVALEYGAIDWPEAAMGLREWISNALDAGAKPSELLVLTDKLEASDDEVAIFIPYNGVAKEYFDNIEKYFLHFTEKQNTKVIEKPDLSRCRIYRKGVFIRELQENSLFDYNLLFSINECRTGSSDRILSDIEYENRFGTALTREMEYKIVEKILSKSDIVETKKDNWHGISYGMSKIFESLVGKIGLCPDNFIVANCVPVDSRWHKAIVKGVPDINGLTGVCEAELQGYDIIPPAETIRKQYDSVCELIETVGLSNGLGRPKLITYRSKDELDKTPSFYGLYDLKACEVMLWADNAKVHETIVHELSHHYTFGADDHSARFAAFGHELVAAIITQLM